MENYKKIYGCGSGSYGLLSNNLEDNLEFKILEKLDIEPEFIDMGGTFAVFTNKENEIFLLGSLFEEFIIKIPEKIFFTTKIIKIACGWSHVLFLTEKNEVFAKGKSNFGEIPNLKQEKNNYNEIYRLEIDFEEKIIDIFCGFRQSFLITDKNMILCSGYNKNNELGVFNDGICRKLEKNDFFMNLGKIIKISTGQKFTIFQIESNLYGVGDNKYGQLILNEKKIEKITKIYENTQDFSIGWSHLMIFSKEKRVFMCGRGDFGQQGIYPKEKNEFHEIRIEGEIIKKAVSGSEYCFVITENQNIYSWGWNEHGNLGLKDLKNRFIPTKIELELNNINDIKTRGATVYLY